MSFLLKCDLSFVKNNIYKHFNSLFLNVLSFLYSSFFKWTVRVFSSEPYMQRWQCPIYNFTLEIIWSKMWKIPLFSVSKSFYFPEFLSCFLKKQETTIINKQFKGTKTLISNTYLIRQSFQGNRRKMGIAIFALRVTWKYAHSPFKV